MSTIQQEETADTISTRAAIVVWRMAHGWRPTTREVAALCGIGMGGAWAMMARIRRGVPIALGCDKRWYDITLHYDPQDVDRAVVK